MTSVEVVHVGDGACSVIDSVRTSSMMVIDCGSLHDVSGAPSAHQLATLILPRISRLRCLAVSHFDADHWKGLAALPALLPQSAAMRGSLEFVYPQLPATARWVPALLHALATHMPAYPAGSMAEVVDAWAARGVKLNPRPKQAGQSFHMAGEDWDVLWPPAVLPVGWGKRATTLIRRARELANHPENGWLDEAFRKAYGRSWGADIEVDVSERETFDPWKQAQNDLAGPFDESEDALYNDSDHGDRGDRGGTRELGDGLATSSSVATTRGVSESQPIRELFGRLQGLNNELSLVLSSASGRLLAMGDVKGFGLRRSLQHPNLRARYMTILAPHHGTIAPTARQESLMPRARWLIAQNGPIHHPRLKWAYIARHVRCTHDEGNIRA
ncbi:ComEC/Rec2 family competence protein [Curtobacterium sp. SGAir0471]|uniref:hypothetical protein n=1 Tax=Curtobacterium sp. SGAir0471 TaxID=2070337 RepID=UPI0010F48209|nr:hypothetical protein [Curtobacterium sp. SGAir0471]